MDDIFLGYGVEIKLPDPDAFLKIKETLTRIGIASKKSNILYQSCHILHKRGRYSILHFKELFALDGKPSSISDDDLARRNTIVKLLEDWKLLSIISNFDEEFQVPLNMIKIISFKDKPNWICESKYTIGEN